MRRGNKFLAAGLLLLSAAILLEDVGWIPHEVKLLMMGLACGLELYGMVRECRK